MTDLLTLSRRVSEADGPSRELDLQVSAALFWKPGWIDSVRTAMAPAGTVWFTAGNCDQAMALHCDWTASLDAVAALIAEKLPGWAWSAGVDHEEFLMAGEPPCSGTVMGNVREWQPAFDEPPEIAYDHHERKAATPALALLSAAILAIHERKEP
jgi:hypothetical protein